MTGRPQVCTHEGCEKKPAARRLCSAHYQAAWKRGEFDNAPLPPRTRARTVCPPDHKHGEKTTCYIQHQCRCDACRDHNRDRERDRNRQKAYGTYDTGLVDATPARLHVLALGEQGMGYKRVAEVAGVHVTAVRNLIWGRDDGARKGELQKRIGRERSERILAVVADVTTLADGANVPATGTVRRVQALVARGWSFSKVAEHVGMEIANFLRTLQGASVHVSTHRTVAEVFERLWNVEPPRTEHRDAIAYSRALRLAERRGYVPPMGWDDIDTDPAPPMPDGEEFLDEGAIDAAVDGHKPTLHRGERAARLASPVLSEWTRERAQAAEDALDRISKALGVEVSAIDGRREWAGAVPIGVLTDDLARYVRGENERRVAIASGERQLERIEDAAKAAPQAVRRG